MQELFSYSLRCIYRVSTILNVWPGSAIRTCKAPGRTATAVTPIPKGGISYLAQHVIPGPWLMKPFFLTVTLYRQWKSITWQCNVLRTYIGDHEITSLHRSAYRLSMYHADWNWLYMCYILRVCILASIRITFNALSFGKIGDRDMFINHPLLIFNGRDVCIIQTFDV